MVIESTEAYYPELTEILRAVRMRQTGSACAGRLRKVTLAFLFEVYIYKSHNQADRRFAKSRGLNERRAPARRARG